MKKRSHSFETLEQSYDDLSSPLKSMRRPSKQYFTRESLDFVLKVFNSSLIYSSLTIPLYFQVTGVAIGVSIFLVFFIFSFIESTLLLDLKYYARSRLKPGTLSVIFKLFKIPKYIADIYRGINIINANLYVVLLMAIFQQSMQAFLYTICPDDKAIHQGLMSQQFIQFCGTILIVPFFVKWFYPVYFIVIVRLMGLASIILISICSFYIYDSNKTQERAQIISPQGNVVEIWTTIPCVMLAFAYQQQFFTGQLNERPIKTKDDDLEKKLKMGAFYGSLLMMIFELTVCLLAAYGFYLNDVLNRDIPGEVGNLIEMTFFDQCFRDNMTYPRENQTKSCTQGQYQGYAISFYIMLAFSAQFQIVQYVPQAVVMILNVLEPKKPNDPEKSTEFILIEQITSEQSLKKYKKEESIKSSAKKGKNNQIKESLILNDGSKLRINYKPSLISAIVFYLVAFLIAMCEPPVLLISSLMGCLTQNFITFLIPSILYLDPQFASDANPYKQCFAWFAIIFSITFALVGASFGLYSLYIGSF